MFNPFDVIPADITDAMDAWLRNRWYHDPDEEQTEHKPGESPGHLRLARELVVIHRDTDKTEIPMIWDTEARTWVEDKRFKRRKIKSVASMIRDMKF